MTTRDVNGTLRIKQEGEGVRLTIGDEEGDELETFLDREKAITVAGALLTAVGVEAWVRPVRIGKREPSVADWRGTTLDSP